MITMLLLFAVLLIVVDVALSAASCQVVTIFGLKTADCERLGLSSVPRDLDNDLKVMRLADNALVSLGADEFARYSTLHELRLARNRISIVLPDALRGMPNLQALDLTANLLSVVRADFLRHLTSVRTLVLARNPIVAVDAAALRPLRSLERVSFADCRLTRVDARLFDGLGRLADVDISGNRLRQLSAAMEAHLPPALSVFRFYGNPWTCDCRLRWLRRWSAGSTRQAHVNWDFGARNTPTCAAPPLLRSVRWKHLEVDQFACPSTILVNVSTSTQLRLGENATITCTAFGDPEPEITWYRDARKLFSETEDGDAGSAEQVTDRRGRYVYSRLMLRRVDIGDVADYKCVAQNSAGRSEVTFKTWLLGHAGTDAAGRPSPNSDDEQRRAGGTLTTDIVIGVACGVGVVVFAALIAAVVCVLRRRRPCHRKYAYYVRDAAADADATAPSLTAAGRRSPPVGWFRRLVVPRSRRTPLLRLTANGTRDGCACRCPPDAAAADAEDDKYLSSTLQSLLGAKQILDEPPGVDAVAEITQLNRNDYSSKEDQFSANLPADNNNTATAAAAAAVADDCATIKSGSYQLSAEESSKTQAPDLLTGDEHAFRRGSVLRSPYRRPKPKVSFADCQSPSSISTFDGAESGGDGPTSMIAGGQSGVSSVALRCGDLLRPGADADDVQPSSMRRSRSSNCVGAPKPSGSPSPRFCTTLFRSAPNRRRQTVAAGSQAAEPLTCIQIALPSTISGVTDGLFPPSKPALTHEWRASGDASPARPVKFASHCSTTPRSTGACRSSSTLSTAV